MALKKIVIIGTLDTKSEAIFLVKQQIEARQCQGLILDISVGSKPMASPDITAEEIARLGGGHIDNIWGNPDRQKINKIVTDGAIKKLDALYGNGDLDGVISIGGAGGTLMGTNIMKSLPFGVPKFMVSANAGLRGFASRSFGHSDITMMHTVVDIIGINDMLSVLLKQAAAAICAMVETDPLIGSNIEGKPKVAVCELAISAETMNRLKKMLEERGYRTVNFMATGVSDTAMEEFIERGLFDAVIDLSPGNILDGLIEGGARIASPTRFEAAGKRGIPQIIGPAGLEFIAPRRSAYIPEYKTRKSYRPDKLRVLLRSNAEELTRAAKILAGRLNKSKGPVRFLIPSKGWSNFDGPGRPLDDPEADQAFVNALKQELKPEIEVKEINVWMEDPIFATAICDALDEMMNNKD
jgi:uncharacterized protein (UPF0261 family)